MDSVSTFVVVAPVVTLYVMLLVTLAYMTTGEGKRHGWDNSTGDNIGN
jgi:hypothetical protein